MQSWEQNKKRKQKSQQEKTNLNPGSNWVSFTEATPPKDRDPHQVTNKETKTQMDLWTPTIQHKVPIF